MSVKFKRVSLNKKLFIILFAVIMVNFCYMGSSFAVTGNISNNTTAMNSSNMTVAGNGVNKSVETNIGCIQGVYINPADTPANTVNVTALKNDNITQVYVLTNRQNPTVLTPYITLFNGTGIGVYAWVECFKDFNGNWFNPEANATLENQIINDIDGITVNYNINGVMLDYLRFPGTAYLYPNATLDVDNFAAAIRSNINLVNSMDTMGKPFIYLSAALMPEGAVNSYYYGQNYTNLSKYLDFLSPMIYVGNYGETTSWIGTATAYIVSQANGTPVVSILQTYSSDANPSPISVSQLDLDIQTALLGDSDGFELFQYDLLPGNWMGYQTPVPTPPPVIINTTPIDNAVSVSLSSPVTISFNENITTAMNYFDVTVKNKSTGSMVAAADLNGCINGNVFTITQTGNRLTGDTYQVYIPAGAVESMSGNILNTSYTFNFTSINPVTVISSNPLNKALGVSLSAPVTVKFNENITSGSDYTGIYIKNISTGKIVGIGSKTITGNTLTITMSSNRLYSDTYLVYLPVGAVKDLIGDNLTSAYNFTFTTLSPLKVTSTVPLNNALGVSLSGPVTVKFNENITAGADYTGIYILNTSTGKIVKISKKISGNTLTITMSSSRLYNDTYRVYIPVGAIHDSLGYTLNTAYIFTFKTLK